ncbi:L-aspartate oxidase [Halalkalibacter alkaliphilus]|uniref:FAD-binding protein n=1 Tax=Halalkalibacter alkaliphilus TaxID=2917993 RepID=A0A9X2CX16_9BACI|nr:FAD-binding protein [Halalkalibacter alkaliphilus]MCL7749687.1 FAD-binding protein [Halalkalibacter alkaliphilus]
MDVIETDILIIGSGAAGLTAAVYAGNSTNNVLVLDKGVIGKSGSTIGAVQIASLGAWSNPLDSESHYVKDMKESGRGLSNPKLIETLASDLSARLKEIIGWGLKLDVNEDEEVSVFATSGHSVARSVSARKGKTGLGIAQTLTKKLKSMKNIRTWSDVITVDLVTSSERVTGALVFDLRTNHLSFIQSKTVILATGGIGQLYPVTSNPVQATSDGFSLGLGASASLIDMEQVQFYPVSLVSPHSLAGFCISFYHYSKLYNIHGERFMKRYEPETLENTTRDKLAIAIHSEIAAGRGTPNGGVWLDATEQMEKVKNEFPHEYKLCEDRGIDLSKDYAEIAPAAHFMMGGIQIDKNAASSVPGLYAAGETAGGLHGGNRLGNNALSECLVFGAKAGMAAAIEASELSEVPPTDISKIEEIKNSFYSPFSSAKNSDIRPFELKQKIQEIMGQKVGVIRTNNNLKRAKELLTRVKEQFNQIYITHKEAPSREILDYIESRHMIRSAEAIIRAATMRKESRGAHYSLDHPTHASTIHHTVIQYENGQMKFNMPPAKGV